MIDECVSRERNQLRGSGSAESTFDPRIQAPVVLQAELVKLLDEKGLNEVFGFVGRAFTLGLCQLSFRCHRISDKICYKVLV